MKKILFTAAVCCLTLTAQGEDPMNTRFKDGVLHFDYTAAALAPAEEAARARLETALKAVIDVPAAERTFDNTVTAYSNAFEDYSDPFGTAFFLAQVSPDKPLRDAATALEERVSQYLIEVSTRKELYNAVKEYADTKPLLGVSEAKVLDDMMKGFKKSGLHLPDDKLAELRELNQRESALAIKFDLNVREWNDPLALTKEQLAGLEDNFISRLKKTEDGKYLVTLDYPDYGPFMINAEDDNARKALATKFAMRGGEQNVKILEDILALRRAQAVALGEKNYAAGKLEYRMAKTPEIVNKFLEELKENLQPYSKKEDKTLLAFKRKESGSKEKLQPWQGGYWANKYKKKFYDVDEEKIKEYFPAEHVTENMLKIFGGLFGVKFERAEIPVWHKDVRAFKMLNTEDNALAAYIYMDMYPREGKFKHAACMTLESGYENKDGSYSAPMIAIVANFNPAAGDAPSLLKHGEVETLFHEFGHALHNSLSRGKYKSLSGFGVSWDFVEAPSQLLENWAWNTDVLKQISKHYKTGESLPEDTIKKMQAAKNYGSAGGYLRQNFFATYDMYLHTRTKYVDTTKTYFKLFKSIRRAPLLEHTLPQAAFSHIIGGYDAGYYSYLWSEVIAQDFWSVFEKEGVFNPAVGKKFREQIYAPGSTYDESVIVENFLGRKVSDKAFLDSLGL